MRHEFLNFKLQRKQNHLIREVEILRDDWGFDKIFQSLNLKRCVVFYLQGLFKEILQLHE